MSTKYACASGIAEAGADGLLITEKITLRGVLVEGVTFSLSPKRVDFHPSALAEPNLSTVCHQQKSEEITLTNLSSVFPLEFKISFEYPIDFTSNQRLFEIQPVDPEMCGIVAPGECLKLSLIILQHNIGEISEAIKLTFIDRNSLSRKTAQTIAINIIEGLPGSLGAGSHITDPENNYLNEPYIGDDMVIIDYGKGLIIEPYSAVNNMLPLFSLRGCKKVVDFDFNGLYELDLGQQDISTVPLIKRLTIENISLTRVGYNIRGICETDKNWMIFSRNDGILESSRSLAMQSHTINLTFMISMVGSFSTYLVIENTFNLADSKTVRINLEVVVKQNIKRSMVAANLGSAGPVSNRVFDVYSHAIPYRDAIEMGDLILGKFYTARSFVICNHESVPLAFSVKHDFDGFDGEINFSLSRNTPRLFKSTQIEPESQVKIYIWFFPGASKRPISKVPVRQIKFNIYVNCRLVKDYQKIVQFSANCYDSQLTLSKSEFIFKGEVCVPDLNVSSDIAVFEITNQSDEDVEYEIMGISKFFTFEPSDVKPEDVVSVPNSLSNSFGIYHLPRGTSMKFRIVPLLDILKSNLDILRKERYFIKHFTIINRKRPFERLHLYVKLAFGRLESFQFSEGPRRTYLAMESHIVTFLRQNQENPTSIVVFIIIIVSRSGNQLLLDR